MRGASGGPGRARSSGARADRAGRRSSRSWTPPIGKWPGPPGADVTEALKQGRVQAHLEPPASPRSALADVANTATFTIVFDGSSQASRSAAGTAWSALYRWREDVIDERLHVRGLERPFMR